MRKIPKMPGLVIPASGILLLFVVAHFGHHLVTAILPPLAPYIRDDLKLSYTQWGFLQSAFALSYGFSQIPLGWLSDRLGRRVLITLGISGMAFFAILIGIAPNYYFLVGFLILMGIMGGGYHPAAAPLVSATVDSSQRGRALGIHQLGGTASQLVAPLFVAGIVTLWGWRGSYLSVGVGAFLLGMLLFILLKRNKQGGEATAKVMEKPKLKERFSANFLVGIIAFLIFSTFIQGLMTTTISFSTLFLVDHFAVSNRLAATMYILIISGGLLGGPISGYLSDRLGSLKIVIFLSFLAIPAIYLLTLVPFNFLTVGLLLVLIGMCQWGRMPVSESYVMSETPERGRSTILGFYYAGGRAFPGLISPIVGVITDHWGIGVSYAAIAITIAVTTVIYLPFILQKRRRSIGIKNDSVL